MKRRPPSRGAAPSPTEAVHPASTDLEFLDAGEVVSRLHAADREIHEAVGAALPAIAEAVDHVSAALRAGGRLFYVGAGTSGRLGALDAAELPPTFGVSPSRVRALIAGGARALQRAVEGAEDDAPAGAAAISRARIGAGDVVCGITASGRTPFVLAALREARRRKARTLLLTCNPSPVPRAPKVDVRIVLDTGPELIAGSTRLKAGTATKLALNLLSTASMIALGKVRQGRMVDLRVTNAKLRERAVRIVCELAGCSVQEARRRLREADGSVRGALELMERARQEPLASGSGARAKPRGPRPPSDRR